MTPSRIWLLLVLTVIPGIAGVAIFGQHAIDDWRALQTAYTHFEDMARTQTDMHLLFVAEARQNMHRLSLFADGVWTLLSAILAGIGVHGLCLSPRTDG